jgi:WD40 repeat protein
MLAFKPHKGAIVQVAFSPDGASLATCGRSPAVCVSDAATGEPRWRGGPVSAGFRLALGLTYSPDGTRLAIVNWSTVGIYNAAAGDLLRTRPGRGYAVAFTPDGEGVVTSNLTPARDAIRTTIRTGRSKRIRALNGMADFNRLRFSPDGRFLAALGGPRMAFIEAETLKGYRRAALTYPGVGALAWHPTARIIVYSDGPKLIAYSWESQWPVAERKRSKKHIQDAAFTPDGKHLITVSNEATAILWETAKWTEVREFAWNIGPLKSIAVAPDGGRAVCASDRGRVVVWDLDL